ncbi:MAG: bifunctional phosphoribosyl-AMP cyclohydrolase/phosphoribosyl-ATP diphosphatase HisIE [Ignavibacteriaceae bacterium]
MKQEEIEKLNFTKLNGLIPAVVIDVKNNQVLMLGFMNMLSLNRTFETGLVTFFSRTRQALWTKGETSGNYLRVVDIVPDCDYDAVVVKAKPEGNTCHTGDYSCFEGIENIPEKNFLNELYVIIRDRQKKMPDNSYTAKLFKEGGDKIIQKVGEEAVETVIAAKNADKKEIINETSDLLYHLLVMLADQEIEFNDIIENLRKRHKK